MSLFSQGRQSARTNSLRHGGPQGGECPGLPLFHFGEKLWPTWDEATLDKWIADPEAVIPGNDMSPPYPGVADPAIRKKIIAFLKKISPQNDGKGE